MKFQFWKVFNSSHTQLSAIRTPKNFLENFWYFGAFFFAYFITNFFSAWGIILIDSSIKVNALYTNMANLNPLVWNGGVQVANIGEIVPFYLIAVQTLLSLATTVMFFLLKDKKYNSNRTNPFALLVVTSVSIGLAMMGVFMAISWTFQWFLASSSGFPILKVVRRAGSWFLFSFGPILVIQSLDLCLMCMIMYYGDSKRLLINVVIKNVVALVLSYALCCYTKLNLFGFITAYLIAFLPFLILDLVYINNRISKFEWKISRYDVNALFKDVWVYGFTGMWYQILKAGAILAIAFSEFKDLPLSLGGYYYARISWYMTLYSLPMLTSPVHSTCQVIKNMDSSIYSYSIDDKANKVEFESIYWMFLLIMVFMIVVGYFVIQPMSVFYIRYLPQSVIHYINTDKNAAAAAITPLPSPQDPNSLNGIWGCLLIPSSSNISPGSMSYVFTAVYVFLIAFGGYLSDKTTFYSLKKVTKKVTLKSTLISAFSTVLKIAIIIGFGHWLMFFSNWAITLLGGYGCAMFIVGVITVVSNFTVLMWTKRKYRKAFIKQIQEGKIQLATPISNNNAVNEELSKAEFNKIQEIKEFKVA